MSEFTYSTVTVSGADAFEFLQAQLATDLASVAKTFDTAGIPESTVHRSAWCNPKGRVICTPTIAAVTDGFELTMPQDLVESVVQRLTMFRFRAKVEFAITATQTVDRETRLRLIQAGIPEISSAQTEKFTPHMLNLDILNMVSVEKGCYPGQEIVARTHFRGASRRRCFRYGYEGLVSAGDKVADGERDLGEVVNAQQGELLAVIPVTSSDSQLFVNELELHKLELPYAV